MGPDSHCCALFPRPSPILLASPEWNLTVTPVRLARTNIPHFFEGYSWLAGFKTLWCLSTTRRTNSSITENHKRRLPSIDRSIEYAWASDVTLRVLLGLLRSSKRDSCVNILAGFDKIFPHCKVIRYVCSFVVCFSSRNGMDSRIIPYTRSPSCYRATWTRQNGLVQLQHLCWCFMAFCWATVLIKGLILVSESVRNRSSIDGTRKNIGFFALSSQHHT